MKSDLNEALTPHLVLKSFFGFIFIIKLPSASTNPVRNQGFNLLIFESVLYFLLMIETALRGNMA